ncbi:MAG: MmcQ/YjbR family DNA-binding protein [Dehalococcoidia bacterium]|nr:MmcQ/YjbR family DNA-binding protein [Dehalococcoidia bacterium]MCB9484691.1 MmcQ/YjbR family DNA-binding protein [Thermoflexaceae bacterium]
MDFAAALEAKALAFADAYADYPWGHESPVFKNAKGKIFVFSGEDERGFHITVKLSPEEGEEAMLLPFVSRAAYVGRFGWVTVQIVSETEWEIAHSWIDRSYELVAGKGRSRRPR